MTLREIIEEIKKQVRKDIAYDVWRNNRPQNTTVRIKGIEGVSLAEANFTPCGYTDDEGYVMEYHEIDCECIKIYDNFDKEICQIYDVDLLD